MRLYSRRAVLRSELETIVQPGLLFDRDFWDPIKELAKKANEENVDWDRIYIYYHIGEAKDIVDIDALRQELDDRESIIKGLLAVKREYIERAENFKEAEVKAELYNKLFGDVTVEAVVREKLEELEKAAEKIKSLRYIAPAIIKWMDAGISWTYSESTRGAEEDKKMEAKYRKLKKKFKELLNVET